MKQQQKSKESKERILDAALDEFGNRPYSEVSLNQICDRHHLSKGLVYHYFSGKDELFLMCVRDCFVTMVEFLEHNISMDGAPYQKIRNYFEVRDLFFRKNGRFREVFRSAVVQSPAHLEEQIRLLRSSLKQYNDQVAKELFVSIPLRAGVTPDEAMEYFDAYGEFLEHYIRNKVLRDVPPEDMVREHERLVHNIFDKMLYGIALQGKEI